MQKDDLISRQAAIDQLHQSYNLLDAERRLEDLLSAQPERKPGKWIVVDTPIESSDICECDQCGGRIWRYKDRVHDWNFCPVCGADMRGEQK